MKFKPLVPNPQSLTIIIAFFVVFAFSGPVSHFGMLKACKISNKGQICGDKTGTSTAVWVKGPSLHWSSGYGAQFYSPTTVDWFVDNMEIGIIRAAMAIKYYKENNDLIAGSGATIEGYDTQPAKQKELMKAVIEAAIINDIYVIVDWHSHNAHNNDEKTKAVAFFKEFATEYKNVPNIIWEVYNEPVNASADQIDSYAKEVISAIRGAGSNNLVIIGSNSWSQNPSSQASKYGTSDKAVTDNVAFVFHFYSESHQQSGNIGTSATSAMNSGYAVFASEWGFTNADGGSKSNPGVGTASTWTSWMDNNKISNCNWSAAAFDESSSMFTSGTTLANLAANSVTLTTSGNNFKSYMGTNKWTAQIPANHPKGNDVTVSVKDGNSISLTTQLGLTGTVSGVSQPEAGEASFTGNSVTYKTSESGTAQEKIRFIYEITQNNITVKRKIAVNITDRRPVLPKPSTIEVSRKAPTVIRTTNLGATDPSGTSLSFKEASISDPSKGTIAVAGASKDSLIFTPNASQHNVEFAEVTLNYTIQNTNGAFSSQSVVLRLKNFAPTINLSTAINCCAGSWSNTETIIRIAIGGVGGKDRDGDSLWFKAFYLPPAYPGSLEKIAPDTLVYSPAPGKKGKIVILSVVTDGIYDSEVGKTALTLTGSGDDIGNITPPNDIPGYTTPLIVSSFTGGMGIKSLGFGRVELNLTQSGVAKLDVYSLSGKHIGTLLNGYQNVGSKEISLAELNLQKGVYMLRLRQGSQIKTLRIVN